MRRIVWLFIGVVLGAVGMWTSMSYHVVRTNDGLTCIPKYRAGLANTFYDVREWGVTEWTEHPELVIAVQKHGRGDILGETKVLGTTLRDAVNLVK